MKVLETGITFGQALDLITGSEKKLGMRLPYWKDGIILVAKQREEGYYLKITMDIDGMCDVFYPNQEEMFDNRWEIVEVEEGE